MVSWASNDGKPTPHVTADFYLGPRPLLEPQSGGAAFSSIFSHTDRGSQGTSCLQPHSEAPGLGAPSLNCLAVRGMSGVGVLEVVAEEERHRTPQDQFMI